ncbi:MAG: YbjN domain-containing protein [Oscillospiraceae bacterium]
MKELIKQVLEEYDWRYTENDSAIRVDVDGENSSWSSFLRPESEDSFSYYSVLPAKVEADAIAKVSELLHRINYAVRVGSFEINLTESPSKGQVMLKTYGLVTENLLKNDPAEVKEIIRRAIAYNMLTMDFYAKHILKAIYGGEVNFDSIFNENERGEQT